MEEGKGEDEEYKREDHEGKYLHYSYHCWCFVSMDLYCNSVWLDSNWKSASLHGCKERDLLNGHCSQKMGFCETFTSSNIMR